jgi:hypothetical protein
MLFREIIAVYCENYTEQINTLCGQNGEILNLIAGGTYSVTTELINYDVRITPLLDHQLSRPRFSECLIWWSLFIFEELFVPKLVKNFLAFVRTRILIIVFTKACHWTLFWDSWVEF